MKKQFLSLLTPVVLICAGMMCLLPAMSARVTDQEVACFVVRGFNMTDFSAWGIIPILSPLFCFLILNASFEKRYHNLLMTGLFAASMFGYTQSFILSREWLNSFCDTAITYHVGAFLYPLTISLLFTASCILKKTDTSSNVRDSESEALYVAELTVSGEKDSLENEIKAAIAEAKWRKDKGEIPENGYRELVEALDELLKEQENKSF